MKPKSCGIESRRESVEPNSYLMEMAMILLNMLKITSNSQTTMTAKLGLGAKGA